MFGFQNQWVAVYLFLTICFDKNLIFAKWSFKTGIVIINSAVNDNTYGYNRTWQPMMLGMMAMILTWRAMKNYLFAGFMLFCFVKESYKHKVS